VWSQAVAKVGSTDPKKVMGTIKAGEWDTVLGNMAFDSKGDIKTMDYVVYQWDSKGNYAQISAKDM
jgi:branched-chain amino acid transport system substrate-binding protein